MNPSGPPFERRDTLVIRVLIPDDISFTAVSACAVVAFAWVLYDYVLTLRDEVALVWRQRIRYAAFLYFWVRYMGLVLLGTLMVVYIATGFTGDTQSPDTAPAMLYLFTPLSQFAVFWAVEIILQCRIYALYRSRRLAILNAALFIVELAIMIVLWFFNPFFNCAIASESKYCGYIIPIYWIPAIIFELWLAALAFRKLQFGWGGDLFTVVVQDSIKYFALIAMVMIVHFVCAFYLVDGFVLSFLVAGQTIGGSRLVLQLRKAYYEGPNGAGTTLGDLRVRRGISTLVDESFYAPPSHIGESSVGATPESIPLHPLHTTRPAPHIYP
ncbi:hypothetical protein EXIGLDRAFT_774942 [Exidia glandulosa HHB12029]|uniref:DUF6533 domain-containing protein n=1 Tax=Exidia glandulosa HHB12029 TaxID=1314781 RepID=A0A165E5H6_EXIGL|nr:hypothetical protein EXIGLDRAFT_774942 [Exidia glandulosa HHB12029]